MSRKRGKSPGWAAFDLKQRQKQGLEPEIEKDPYPSMPSTLATLRTCDNITQRNDISVRPFSSVLLPAVNFPTLREDRDCQKPIQVGSSSGKLGNKVDEKMNHDLTFRKLKELHCWAEDSLIEDVMAAVDDNIDTASTLLKGMVSISRCDNNKETDLLVSTSHDFQCDKMADKSISFGETADLADLSFTLEDCLKHNSKVLMDEYACGKKIFDDAADVKVVMGHLRSLPVEPEWEEDDVYLIHRKDAIRMTRSASQHSRAATNAFLRGDHFSSQQHSKKAQEEWLAAEKLNAKAAKEILSIRNIKNDKWKLDLHGLHAAEAIQALQEHLQKIEARVPLNQSVSPTRVNLKDSIVRSSSLESFSGMDMDKLDKQQASSRQRSTSLQIITGVGNHSRGQAALPTVVRSFLIENGYRFDEARPGMITVRPKFRHR